MTEPLNVIALVIVAGHGNAPVGATSRPRTGNDDRIAAERDRESRT